MTDGVAMNQWEHLLQGEYAERSRIISGLILEQVSAVPAEQGHSIFAELWLAKNCFTGSALGRRRFLPSTRARKTRGMDGFSHRVFVGARNRAGLDAITRALESHR